MSSCCEAPSAQARSIAPRVLRVVWLTALLLLAQTQLGWAGEPSHGIAMHGRPLHAPEMAHFPYVNPQAPKGGRISLGAVGTFDSLNPFIIKGNAPPGLRGYVYESLMARALDEPFSLYGLLAERIEVPEDRSSITFHLRAAARFSDGRPVTADDVLFSLDVLRQKGWPFHRSYYKKVVKAEKLSARAVRFVFADGSDREMPLIMGLMPVLPSHLLTNDSFALTTLKPPVGSGPYLVDGEKLLPGRSITYRRNPEYWGRDLAVNKGRYNFAEIRYEYFRDSSSLFEAFKTGAVDLRDEDDPSRWAEGYAFPAAADGRIKRRTFSIALPSGMTGLVMNTRRAAFKDQRVRRAFVLLFDFEWINRSLFHGAYARTRSYFDRSELSSHGRPADAEERRLLAPYLAEVKPEILAGVHRFPVSDGSGRDRRNVKAAFDLLVAAGYRLDGTRLVHGGTRQPLSIEMLADTRSKERLFASFAVALRRVGIEVRIRQVDSAQYWSRLKAFDFDMVQWTWGASLSPGNEQIGRWSSQVADTPGALNYAGVRSKGVDAMIEALLAARDRPAFVSAVRAFDRLLLSGDYVVPLYHLPKQMVAHWSHLAAPAGSTLYGYDFDTWWSERR
ncbi:MAG: extracellular solute-binding protein [Hyphomicrobiaceae bacterium]